MSDKGKGDDEIESPDTTHVVRRLADGHLNFDDVDDIDPRVAKDPNGFRFRGYGEPDRTEAAEFARRDLTERQRQARKHEDAVREILGKPRKRRPMSAEKIKERTKRELRALRKKTWCGGNWT